MSNDSPAPGTIALPQPPMPDAVQGACQKVVVVGASAGGVEALRQLVRCLDPVLPAAVLVVLHQPSEYPSVLPGILARNGPLAAVHPAHGEPLRQGRVYVAPPGQHLLLADGRVLLSRGPREHGHRPAVDPLFRSAALEFGPGAVGVVLSGTLDDGSAGLAALVRCGGRAVVQDPAEALYPSMPRAALALVPGALVVTASAAGSALGGLLAEVPDGKRCSHTEVEREVALARMDAQELQNSDRPGTPAGLACPDCFGPLFQIDEPRERRYRCRVGHAWSTESLAARQEASVENALWLALRTLEDKAALHQRIADSASTSGASYVLRASQRRAREAHDSAEVIRQLLLGGPNGGDGHPSPAD